MHCQWRDCQEWRHEGLLLTTPSNEAAKLYDAALTQYVGWYDDASVGGLEQTLSKLLEADQEFVMGHVINNGIQLIGTGTNPKLDNNLRQNLERCYKLASSGCRDLSNSEKFHVNGLRYLADGFMNEACLTWEQILLDCPTDMLAVKFAHDCYFYLGRQTEIRDSIARVLPDWSPKLPLYGYLMGMYSFGLCETSRYEQAEQCARKGLELNRQDAWSSHSLTHVLEMQGRFEEGITFLESTVKDWEPCNMLACHLNWHDALFHIEKGEHEHALSTFDRKIGEMANKTGAMLDVVDASSLLYRLTMEGVDVGGRWKRLYETCLPHLDDHVLAFNDLHFLMAFLGAGQREIADKLLQSISAFVRSGQGSNQQVTEKVGLALCEALVAYNDGDYAGAVDQIWPLKWNIVTIGGSDAQRDLFSQFLIHAAMKSSKAEHHKLARHLLVERKSLKENSPLTDRLLQRALNFAAD